MKGVSALLMLAAVTTFLAGSHRAAFAHSPARQATEGRIDVYVVGGAFDLVGTSGSDGAVVGDCSWLGAAKSQTGVTCSKRLGKAWEQMWVEFVPEADGEVDIDLQGEWYEKGAGDDVRLVWADDVRVEGAQIRRGGFEEAAADGTPAGWRFTGAFPTERYSRDGSVAHGGKACVAVWYGSQARQAFAVEAGRRYRVSAWFRVLDPDAVPEPRSYRFGVPPETYTQTLRVAFDSPEAAGKASVAVAPLYNDHEWAVSCRWDDNNNAADLKMRDVMAAHGYRGTWYLNAPSSWFGPEVGRKLLEGGNSIGGHSMTHPFLTFTNRNRQFWEVLAVRMAWEAAVDRPVCSYAFSFCDFRNPLEGDDVHCDIAEALRRAGYYHIANGWFNDAMPTDLELSPILPSDGAPIDRAVARFLGDAGHRKRHPGMSFSMHVWYNTPEGWANFEGQLDAYGRRPNWWYCNQNEYAAYRWQWRHTKLGEAVRRGEEVVLDIERPVLRELNDAVPLTIKVLGTSPDAVLDAKCGTADLEIARGADGTPLVNLHHDRTRRLPDRIGLVENEDNHAELRQGDVCDDFPNVRGLLHFREGRLFLTLENGGLGPLEDVTITYRLPPACDAGIIRRHVDRVAGSFADSVEPKVARDIYKYTAGTSFYAAQVDFARAGQGGRLHLSCRVPKPARDASYPQGGFLVLGPIASEGAEAAGLESPRGIAELLKEPAALAAGLGLDWRGEGPDARELLDPEAVETAGRWDSRQGRTEYYVLRSVVHSPAAQEAGLLYDPTTVRVVLLNGEPVADESARLRRGANGLVLVVVRAGDRSFTASNAGCFVRLTAPGTRQRLTDIRYEAQKH